MSRPRWRNSRRTSVPQSSSATSKACPTTKLPKRSASNSAPSVPVSTAEGPCCGKSWHTVTRARSRDAASSPSRASRASSDRRMRSQFPFGGKHQRSGSHLEACQECAATVRRERQYLERLRQAPVPPASQDLTARLLSRTHELAAQPEPPASHGGSRMAARALAFTAGGTMAAAGVLAVGAFTAAGDPVAGKTSGTEAAFSHVSSQTPADGRPLDTAQLASLRSEGWACPELQAMGFHLET